MLINYSITYFCPPFLLLTATILRSGVSLYTVYSDVVSNHTIHSANESRNNTFSLYLLYIFRHFDKRLRETLVHVWFLDGHRHKCNSEKTLTSITSENNIINMDTSKTTSNRVHKMIPYPFKVDALIREPPNCRFKIVTLKMYTIMFRYLF